MNTVNLMASSICAPFTLNLGDMMGMAFSHARAFGNEPGRLDTKKQGKLCF